jgi:neutral/alkaline ceramidase-like enzyme
VPVTRAVAAALAVLVLVAGVGSAVGACDACVIAGAGQAPLEVPSGTSLGGFGSFARRLLVPDFLARYPHAFWLKPSAGRRDGIAARALVLERDGHRVTWLTLDVVGIDRATLHAITTRLGDGAGVLLVSASHTHSGPGGYVDSTLAGMLMMDRFDADVRAALLAAAETAVRRAETTRAPARLALATVDGPRVIRSRLGQPLDHALVVLAVRRPDGAPVAAVWNFSIHGTMLGARNLALSGDVGGVASQLIERELGVPALFVPGALGDVSPAQHGAAALDAVATTLAVAVIGGWRAAVPLARIRLTTRAVTLSLPSPHLSLRNCVGRWVPRALTMPLGSLFPSDATLTAVALGDVAWVAVPGELQTALGRHLKDQAHAVFRDVFVAGVTNDYIGYLVTPADYERPSYVTCASVYGGGLGAQLTERAIDLLYDLRGARPRPPAR